jgi:glycerol-3-phosphate dehydrogenase (NAD(P)+)
MTLQLNRIGVIGGGAWGSALAQVAAAKPDRKVHLVMRNAGDAASINETRRHPRRLEGVTLRSNIEATVDPSVLAACDAVIVAVPSQVLCASLKSISIHLPKQAKYVIATKGMDPAEDRDLPIFALLPGLPYYLSGPSFAGDVARELPSAVVLAGMSHGEVARLGNALATPPFRIYFSTDVAGVRIGGPVKNVLAIACGIADGMKLGESARAALVTRGAAELVRIGRFFGAQYETLQGLGGVGDLILTATSRQSRNFSLGVALGEGTTLDRALGESRGVCEGVPAARELSAIAREKKLDLPILSSVARILDGSLTPEAAMHELLDRPLTVEWTA